MSEDEASFFFRQIVHAVDYCHRHRVVHRWGRRPGRHTEESSYEGAGEGRYGGRQPQDEGYRLRGVHLRGGERRKGASREYLCVGELNSQAQGGALVELEGASLQRLTLRLRRRHCS